MSTSTRHPASSTSTSTHSKSRSISSLPPSSQLHHLSRLSSPSPPSSLSSSHHHHTLTMSSLPASPSLGRSPPRARSRPSATSSTTKTATSGLTRSSSTRSRLHSPSRLPDPGSLSYFPPFESMGSLCASASNDDEQNAPGPSTRPSHKRHQHTKGRSLGSLAGLVSWGLSTLSPTSPVPPQDDVERLKDKVGTGQRRVLEALAVVDNLPQERSTARRADVEEAGAGAGKRRMKSEFEVDFLLGVKGNKGASVSVSGGGDEGEVENLVGETPSLRDRRRPRPNLTVPLPSIRWRFPLPSPPVTSLSPHIPLELFFRPIDNPASREPSPGPPDLASSQPTRRRLELVGSSETGLVPDETDVEEIESSLSSSSSPTSSSSTAYSRPCTPVKLQPQDEEVHADEYLQVKLNRLERTVSEVSELSTDSRETIRPTTKHASKQGAWDEVTPKADKWGAPRLVR